MAKTEQKPSYPTKTCPKCGKLIHARSKSHPECGWVMASASSAPLVVAKKKGKGKKRGRPKGSTVNRVSVSVSIEDIRAVKELAERIGAEKVMKLAQVLAK